MVVLADYLAMGVEAVWLIYRAAFTFGTDGLRDADPVILVAAGTEIRLDQMEALAAIY